jgi:hypothetical protein
MTTPFEQVYAENAPIQTKFCSKCVITLPITEFNKNKKQKDGYSIWCKSCTKIYNDSWMKKRQEKIKANEEINDKYVKKNCTECSIEQSLDSFQLHPGSHDGHRNQCKTCVSRRRRIYYEENRETILAKAKASETHKETMRKWRDKNAEYRKQKHEEWKIKRPEYNRIRSRIHQFKNYGVDEDWYNRKLVEQGGICAICGTTESGGNGKRFHIDHDHSCCARSCHACDNCRRGILCNRCNLKLGFLENELWAKQAKAYLNKYRKAGALNTDQPSLFD